MTEDFKTKYRRVVDLAWNQGHADSLDELHSPSYIEHHAPFSDLENLDEFKQMYTGIHTAYPDFHLTIHELILEGDRLAARWKWTGTHLGQTSQLKLAPKGKQLTVSGAHIFHLEGGKLVEGWHFADDLGLLRQLGLAP